MNFTVLKFHSIFFFFLPKCEFFFHLLDIKDFEIFTDFQSISFIQKERMDKKCLICDSHAPGLLTRTSDFDTDENGVSMVF